MADVRKPIPFNTSMTSDKRAENFAYLRRNVLDTNTPGLYPAVDFEKSLPDVAAINSSYLVQDIVGSNKADYDVKVIVDAGASSTKFYNLGSNTEANTAVAQEFQSAVLGTDGVYAMFNDSFVRKIDHSSSNSDQISVGKTYGDSTTTFDITNPSGIIYRFTWVSGTHPHFKGSTNAVFTTWQVGQPVYIQSSNFNVGNTGKFYIASVGSNYFEVYSLGVMVVESGKSLGSGGYIAPGVMTDEPITQVVGGFDGLQYWWVTESISSQLPSKFPVQIASRIIPIGLIVLGIEFYAEFMVIFCTNEKDIIIFFYDKGNSTFFTQRVVVQNSTFLASGVVDGKLLLCHGVGNAHNLAESAGVIRVSQFDGSQFTKLNEISTNSRTVVRSNLIPKGSWDTGNSVIIFAVKDNEVSGTRSDINKNYIYKVYSNGRIVVQTLPTVDGSTSYATTARVFYDFSAYALNGTSGGSVYTNESTNTGFNDYGSDFNETTYITNFLEDPNGYYRLDNVSISFEKLFRNGATSSATDEELLIYYRVSDRVDWTLMATINAQTVIDNVNKRLESPATVPINEQRYQITKMPDGSALPEFNEIQFKFVSKRGFSVIGAWYDMSYISRNKISP